MRMCVDDKRFVTFSWRIILSDHVRSALGTRSGWNMFGYIVAGECEQCAVRSNGWESYSSM